MRDLLTAARYKFLPAHFLIRYFQTLRFSWPYDIRDVYQVNTETKEHIFTDEFDRKYHDLRSWSLQDAQRQRSSGLSVSPSVVHEDEARSEKQRNLKISEGKFCRSGQSDGKVVPIPNELGWFTTYETEIWTVMNID